MNEHNQLIDSIRHELARRNEIKMTRQLCGSTGGDTEPLTRRLDQCEHAIYEYCEQLVDLGPVGDTQILGASGMNWIDVKDSLPDADSIVLIHTPESDCETVWVGYLDGDVWRTAEGFEAVVTHWKQLPDEPNAKQQPCAGGTGAEMKG